MTPLTAQRLRDLLSYDPATGKFNRKVTRGPCHAGAEAGGVSKHGYWRIDIDGVRYYGHRLAWLYVHGNWPSQIIDHINGNRTDNRIENLRDVPPSVNQQNQRRATKASSTGFMGVYPSGRKFAAGIGIGNVGLYIGTYDTAAEAHAAYVEKKRELHVGCPLTFATPRPQV